VTNFSSSLALERARRARALSDVRVLYARADDQLKHVAAQAVIVLCYASWEGYFNFCADVYISHVNSLRRPLVELNPALLACVIDRHLESLKDRDFRPEHKPSFARSVYSEAQALAVEGNTGLLKAASNLDYDRLSICLDALDVDACRFVKHQNFIKHELVKWRHQVAHGDEPDLSQSDLLAHSERTEELLSIMGEAFEDSLLRISR
jgi:hypothetical protein